MTHGQWTVSHGRSHSLAVPSDWRCRSIVAQRIDGVMVGLECSANRKKETLDN